MKDKIKKIPSSYKVLGGKQDLITEELFDLFSVIGCLICIMDNVEGDGLTKGMRYKILAEKDGMYCIIDDNSKLGVYGEIFFDKE